MKIQWKERKKKTTPNPNQHNKLWASQVKATGHTGAPQPCLKHCHYVNTTRILTVVFFTLFSQSKHSQQVSLNLRMLLLSFNSCLLAKWAVGTLTHAFHFWGCPYYQACLPPLMNFKTGAVNESFKHWNLTNIYTDIPSNSLQPSASFCDVETGLS